jgi:putative ABC transport system substrate-binding protein
MAHLETDPEFQDYLRAFRAGLQSLGWTEDRNIRIDVRWGALDDAEGRQRSAKELVALQPDLIVTQNTPPTAAMLLQTSTIPVIFVIVADPVGSGFVKSLAHPGGNATGFTIMEPTIVSKWLELLKEIAPHVTHAALLFNPATSGYLRESIQNSRPLLWAGGDHGNSSRQRRARKGYRGPGTPTK